VKALFYEAHGDVDVLRHEEVGDPTYGPGDVVVRVRATAVNHLDVIQRAGWFTMPGYTLPHIAGMDLAGEIVAVGADVDASRAGLRVGDRVVADPSLSEVAANSRFAGRGDLYGVLGILGATEPGGYAELCAVPASHVHPIPDDVSFEEAASLPTVFMTAWHALFEIGRLAMGETVLLHGASSGVSSAAIQLAKHAGAVVLATATTDAKCDWASSLGADHVLNNRTGNVTAWAREMTGGRGVDMVLDHVGPALWEASMFSLRPRGRLVFCGNTTGNEVTVNLGFGFHMGVQLLGSDPYRYDEFARMLAVYWRGGFRSIVDSVLPLADAGVAHQRMLAGEFMGKIVLVP
jgi:NADPH:quinone reductase-like Zn-dependent oxidoreductase